MAKVRLKFSKIQTFLSDPAEIGKVDQIKSHTFYEEYFKPAVLKLHQLFEAEMKKITKERRKEYEKIRLDNCESVTEKIIIDETTDSEKILKSYTFKKSKVKKVEEELRLAHDNAEKKYQELRDKEFEIELDQCPFDKLPHSKFLTSKMQDECIGICIALKLEKV